MSDSIKKRRVLFGAAIGIGTTLALVIGLGVLAGAGVAAGTAAPRNTSPATIQGKAEEGSVLTVDRGSWKSDSKVAFSYQWRRCLADGTGCVDIPKATDRLYTARAGDLAHTMRVAVTAANKDGVSLAASLPTALVTALPAEAPHNTRLPTISGSAKPGQTLTADPGTWTGASTIAFSYRWRLCDSQGGGDCTNTSARTQTYKLGAGDAKHTLRVLVSATNQTGASASLSDPSPLVASPSSAITAPPKNVSPPAIVGTPRSGQILTAQAGSWTGSPLISYGYKWLRCNKHGRACAEIAGAHAKTYTLVSADVGNTIRVIVAATNSKGSARSTSAQTAIVAPPANTAPVVAPQNSSPPTISGTPQQGQTLKGDKGRWTNNPSDYNYFWMRCDRNGSSCADIGAAHASSYTLTSADVANTIRFKVQARNAGGSTGASSAPTAVIQPASKPPPQNASPPTISGTPQQGQTLKGDRGRWTNNPSDYSYFWMRCDRNGSSCADIGGAHASSYTLTSADVANTIRFKVQARNAGGSTGASSAPTAVIQPASKPPPTPATGCPSGTGPVHVASVGSPARLLIDQQQTSPSVVTRGTNQLIVRYHVSACGGRSVQGALVYATAVPFNQVSIPPEQPTNQNGWAELHLRTLAGFPVGRHQQLIVLFVRARKPGGSLLAGISTRRLVSIRVDLGR